MTTTEKKPHPDHFDNEEEALAALNVIRGMLSRTPLSAAERAAAEATLTNVMDTLNCFANQTNEAIDAANSANEAASQLASICADMLIIRGAFLAHLKRLGTTIEVTTDEVDAAMKGGHDFKIERGDTGSRISAVEDASSTSNTLALVEALIKKSRRNPLSHIFDIMISMSKGKPTDDAAAKDAAAPIPPAAPEAPSASVGAAP